MTELQSVELTLAATFILSLVGLVAAFVFWKFVFKQDTGDDKMRSISDAIREGGEAFLKRQNTTIFLLSIVFAGAIFGFYTWRGMPAFNITMAFLTGAVCSGLAGYIGMYVSLRSNIRTASAARSSLNKALQVALRGGAVSGMCVVAMSLLGVLGLFLAFDGTKIFSMELMSPEGKATPESIELIRKIANQIVGFGFGASFVALFAQLGGGIYTKAADVGADLVGKVEAGIPEDDPRNPAVIADLVGDNVGDCAGRGADLFESTAAENVGAIILAAALVQANPQIGVKAIFFPLLARAFGIVASIVGVFLVSMKSEDEDPMHALNRGYYVTTVGAIIGFLAAVLFLLDKAEGKWWYFVAGLVGIATSFAFVWITQYYTEYKYRPVQSIADACKTGAATNIIMGFAVALECTAAPVLVISAAILISYWCGSHTNHGGLFGTAVATMGMLSTAGYILAMDTFGPITDNAGGIIEMSEQPEEIRKKTDRLDAVGNTTKALTKGYAIGSAALAAFLLFSAYLEEATDIVKAKWGALGDTQKVAAEAWSGFDTVNIGKVPVFVGGLLGAALCFLFASFAIKAVGRAAFDVIEAVREQFRNKPGIMQGTEKPDYARCVDIVTRGALRSMIVPGVVAVAVPVLVGWSFGFMPESLDIVHGAASTRPPFSTLGIESVAALLMVGTIAGILLATVLNNGGGAWDNAKKYIETGVHGGKKSEAHKAAVVGDTVGDPFKDTAGPSLHVLIKLLATITLVFVPLFVH